MPKAMTDAEIDPAAEQVDLEMMASGEAAGVLSHLTATERGEQAGRPTVRLVWEWNGRQTSIPLAYEANGKRHDGGRKYLLKRHCTVCNFSGFYGQACPQCKKDGRKIAPPIPAYYLKASLVPQAQQFFGTVNCFVPTCTRRGEFGFMDEAQMRQHGMSRHRIEYRAYQDAQASRQQGDMDSMRRQLEALQAQLLQAQLNTRPLPAPVATPVMAAPEPVAAKSGMTDANRAARSARLKQIWAERKAKKAAIAS